MVNRAVALKCLAGVRIFYNPHVQTLTEIRQLLTERGLRPKHRLGQNFLHDKNQLVKLLEAADIQRGDVVLEVGPGTGTLTSALLEREAEVIACELDQDMAGIIEEVFAEQMIERESRGRGRPGSLMLIKGDALAKDRRLNPQIIEAMGARSFKLVANLPYQIASSLMTTLLIDHGQGQSRDAKPQAAECVGQFVTIQKEVAERLQGEPGTKEYGPLSIIVQAFAEVQTIGVLSATCFWPPPEVTSAMVSIVPHSIEDRGLTRTDRRDFARFVVDLFTKRRKQLGTTFGRSAIQWPADISPEQRAETLTPTQVIALWRLTSNRN